MNNMKLNWSPNVCKRPLFKMYEHNDCNLFKFDVRNNKPTMIMFSNSYCVNSYAVQLTHNLMPRNDRKTKHFGKLCS